MMDWMPVDNEYKMTEIDKKFFSIPFSMISSLKESSSTGKRLNMDTLEILTKDFRRLKLSNDRVAIMKILEHAGDNNAGWDFPNLYWNQYLAPNSTPSSFARTVTYDAKFKSSGWDVYQFDEEFKRQGVHFDDGIVKVFKEFSCWQYNEETRETAHQYSLTYPERIIVPYSIAESNLYESAGFRTKNWLPALTWYSPDAGSIWRSSQIKRGLYQNSNEGDQSMLTLIG